VKADPGDEKPPVGIDMGCVTTATLSSNERHEIPKTGIMLLEKEARKLQKKLSRQQRFGSNWHKTKSKVAKVHSKISRIRHDWLQKTTTEITKNHGIVCVEDLSVRNMTASARGTAENPGRNVRQKAGLNRSILRNSWGEFVRQIAYKLEWSGGTMVKVPAPHTSQKCSSCGHTDQKNRTEQSKFSCVRCGFEEHADVNAAKNILEAGLSLLGDMGRHEAA
jgi:putative transposase